MKSVSGKIVSSKPISLSKASKILSKFVSFENGASQPVSVYLRRASAAFTELTRFHKEQNPSRSHRKHRFKNYNSVKTVQVPEEIDGARAEKRENKKKKSEGVETESGSSLGVELEKRKEKKKRKGGEIDDDVVFDSGEQKKKKKRRIEGND